MLHFFFLSKMKQKKEKEGGRREKAGFLNGPRAVLIHFARGHRKQAQQKRTGGRLPLSLLHKG